MKKINFFLLFAVFSFYCLDTVAQNRNRNQNQNQNQNQTQNQNQNQNQEDVSDEVLLELYKGARVTDVVDGMVTVGYMDVGVFN